MRKTLFAGLALTAVVAGGAAYAAIPASNGTIHGCYSNLTGNLKVIDSSASCGPLSTALNWNQTNASQHITESWTLHFTTPVPPATAAINGSGYYDPTTEYIDSNNYLQAQVTTVQNACPSGLFPLENFIDPAIASEPAVVSNNGPYWVEGQPTGFSVTRANTEVLSSPGTVTITYYMICG